MESKPSPRPAELQEHPFLFTALQGFKACGRCGMPHAHHSYKCPNCTNWIHHEAVHSCLEAVRVADAPPAQDTITAPRIVDAHPLDNKFTTPSGATSSGEIPHFDELPLEAINAYARRCMLGEVKYGRHNWRKGLNDPVFLRDRLNHMLNHAFRAAAKMSGVLEEDGDDDLAAVMWNAGCLITARDRQKGARG